MICGPYHVDHIIWSNSKGSGAPEFTTPYAVSIESFLGHMHQSECISGLKYSYGTLKFSGTPN